MNPTNARTATLILCLALLAILLGSMSAGLGAPLSALLQKLPAPQSQQRPSAAASIDTGTILVRASFYLGGLQVLPVQNATVGILVTPSRFLPLLLETNSSGEAETRIGAGNYTLTVSDRLFTASSDVRVYQNQTTEADVVVSGVSDKVVFGDLPDEDSSGYVAPWQSIVLAVNASSGVTNSTHYFLDLSYGQAAQGLSGSSVGPEPLQDVSVTTVASQVRGTGASSLLWLTLRPEGFVSLSDVTGFTLVSFTAVTRISYQIPITSLG